MAEYYELSNIRMRVLFMFPIPYMLQGRAHPYLNYSRYHREMLPIRQWTQRP